MEPFFAKKRRNMIKITNCKLLKIKELRWMKTKRRKFTENVTLRDGCTCLDGTSQMPRL